MGPKILFDAEKVTPADPGIVLVTSVNSDKKMFQDENENTQNSDSSDKKRVQDENDNTENINSNLDHTGKKLKSLSTPLKAKTSKLPLSVSSKLNQSHIMNSSAVKSDHSDRSTVSLGHSKRSPLLKLNQSNRSPAILNNTNRSPVELDLPLNNENVDAPLVERFIISPIMPGMRSKVSSPSHVF